MPDVHTLAMNRTLQERDGILKIAEESAFVERLSANFPTLISTNWLINEY